MTAGPRFQEAREPGGQLKTEAGEGPIRASPCLVTQWFHMR